MVHAAEALVASRLSIKEAVALECVEKVLLSVKKPLAVEYACQGDKDIYCQQWNLTDVTNVASVKKATPPPIIAPMPVTKITWGCP